MSSATLGQLVVQLAADTVRFEGDLGRAATIAGERFARIKDDGERALGGLIAAAASAAGALATMFEAGNSRGAETQKLSEQVGLTAESLSRLQFAAKSVGVPVDALETGLKRLSVTVGSAAGGNKKAQEIFTALGVSIYDAGGNVKAVDTLFSELAAKFATYQEGTIKTADAVALFGKAGNELLPVLDKGSDGLQRLAERSDQLGFTISGPTAKAAHEFTNKMTDLHAIFEGLETHLAAAMLPTLTKLVDALLDTATNGSKLSSVLDTLVAGFKVAETAALAAYSAINVVGKAIGDLIAAQYVLLNDGNVKGSWKIFVDGAHETAAAIEKDFGIMNQVWDKAEENFGVLGDSWDDKVVKKLSAPIIEHNAFDLAGELSKELERIDEQTRKQLQHTGDAIDKVKPHLDDLGKNTKHMWDELDGYALQGAQNIQGDLTAFFLDPAKVGFQGLLLSFVRTLEQMVAQAASAELLKALFGSTASGGSTGGLGNIFSSFLTSGISGTRASGGPVSGGSSYIVGENGPELFTPGSNGSIAANGMAGGAVFNHVYNIDAKGADAERIMGIMPSLLENTRAATKRDILDAFRRSGMPAPRTA